MAKAVKSPKRINVRWQLSEDVLKKIAVYQKSHDIKRMEVAADILLRKATEPIKPIEL